MVCSSQIQTSAVFFSSPPLLRRERKQIQGETEVVQQVAQDICFRREKMGGGGVSPFVRRSWALPVLWQSPHAESPGWLDCRSRPAWCGCDPEGCHKEACLAGRALPLGLESDGGPPAPGGGGCGCVCGCAHGLAACRWFRGSWGWGWTSEGWVGRGGVRCTDRPGWERCGQVESLHFQARQSGWRARCSAAGGEGWWRPAKRIWCSECTGLGHTERK